MVVARPFSETHPVEPTGPSSVDVATTDPDVQKSSSQAETAAQDGGPRAAAISAELTQWGQTIARELANLDQGLDELKASQAQLARDHAELAGHLKQMQDQMARHDTDFADSLKTAQEEIARGNLSTAAQLEASQDQMTRIGEQLEARQKDADRLGAPKQFPQPNLASQSPSRPNAAQAPKRAPKSPPQSALLPTHSEALPNQH
jgi:chromosome segregation ATPase